MKKKKDESTLDVDFNKWKLEQMYENAKAEGTLLWPDDAIKALMVFWEDRFEKYGNRDEVMRKVAIANPKLDLLAGARETHIYAVNLFYQTFFPRKGAPPLQGKYLEYLLELRDEGKSYPEIALTLNPNLSTSDDIEREADKVRKQIKAAEKRYRK